jgi:S1-C subfamily serine protease
VSSLLESLSDDLQQLVARVGPAVLGIEQGRGAGTAVVVARDGYLLTNHHVAGSGRGLRVRLPDGEAVGGELVGSDAATDLAVVRLREAQLVQLPIADPASVAVGQLVVAIGNPFRFERSVSLGIVSALDRSLPGPNGVIFEGLIQTDAAINPGNSGGPLVNAKGEVVGINTAVIPWAQGMGFAVSARTATWVTSVLMQRGRVDRRYLGVAARSEQLAPALATATGQAKGVRILQIGPGSPAESAGLRPDDLLLGVHGEAVSNVDDIHRLMVTRGTEVVPLALWRKNAREFVTVVPSRDRRAA